MKNMGHDKKSNRLHERIGVFVSRGQYRRALEILDQVIEDPLPLFQGEAWVIEERRLAWLYRIDLLSNRLGHEPAVNIFCAPIREAAADARVKALRF